VRKALILEGWFNNPDDNWYPWLKKELEKKGYKVYIPELPTMDTKLPDMQKQIKFVEKNFRIDESTVIIGHSLGAILALRLAERYKYQKMFLVAGWDFDDLTEPRHRLFWKNKINHSKIKKNVKEIYCVSSDNDPYTTAVVTEQMSKRLKGKFILIKDSGHFTKKDGVVKIPQLLKYA